MKRLILLTIILTAGAVTGRIAAQDAASVSKRANQQYVLFESERDKGTNITAMYDYLLESYVNFIKIVEAPDNGQYLSGAKNRLRAMQRRWTLHRLISICPSWRYSVVSCCLRTTVMLRWYIMRPFRLTTCKRTSWP